MKFTCDIAGHEEELEGVDTIGMGQCPLVLGECVQGRTEEHGHFLVTSPIGLFSWAEFVRTSSGDALHVEPAYCWKAASAVKRYLQVESLPQAGFLRLSTPLKAGQGFGTSTADIAASLRAAAAAWKRTITPDTIARIAISIEPSDGSMYSDCVVFAHRRGVVLEHLGALPRFEAIVLCPGGMVETLQFDQIRKDFHYSQRDQSAILSAWERVRQGNKTGNALLLAEAATISAAINEQLLPKPFFKELSRFVSLRAADGIMVAHSGTALALILDPAHRGHRERIKAAEQLAISLRPASWFRISNYAIHQRVRPSHTEQETALAAGTG